MRHFNVHTETKLAMRLLNMLYAVLLPITSLHKYTYTCFAILCFTMQAYNYTIYMCILDYVQYYIDMCGEIIICLNYNNLSGLCVCLCLCVCECLCAHE